MAELGDIHTIGLPCGCDATVAHQRGERLVACAGDGAACPGGRGYVVTAQPHVTVTYTARAHRPLAAEEAV